MGPIDLRPSEPGSQEKKLLFSIIDGLGMDLGGNMDF